MSASSLFKAVRRVLQLQLLTTLLALAIAWAVGGKEQGVSALLGGLVGFVPNALFALIFGRFNPKRSAGQVVKAFYLGESLKLFLTAVLFVLVFQIPGIFPLPLFATFFGVMAVFWFALLLSG